MQKAYLHNIKAGLAAGYRLCIIDGEEGEVLAKTYSYKEAKEAVECMDVTLIRWQTETTEAERAEGAKAFKPVAVFAVALEYDKEPDETIYDMSANDIADQWFDEYLGI